MKRCWKCGEEKPISAFYKNRGRKDGLTNKCKSCCSIIAKEWRMANPQKHKAATKRWREANLDKRRVHDKRYRTKHLEKLREYNKRWYIENIEKAKATRKHWRKENPLSREKINVASRKWYKNNRDKSNERGARYRARKLNAYVAPVDRQEIFKRDGGRCHICKNKVNPKKWHLDHIMSLSKGGTHEPKNVAVSHPRCNLQKRDIGAAQLRLI